MWLQNMNKQHESIHTDSKQETWENLRVHIYTQKTQRFGAFLVHFMLDLLTQKSDKYPDVLLLHN